MKRARFLVATRENEAAMRRLLRENPMRGSISLTLEREPDYFRGMGLAGGKDRSILVFEGERLACMGRSSVREIWMNGQVRRVGYLGELRLDGSSEGRYDLIQRGYRYFQELDRKEPAEAYFTSIAADNHRARRLLESGKRGLPKYEFLGEYVALVIALPRRPKPREAVGQDGRAEDLEEIASFLNRRARPLSTHWTADRLQSLAAHGLPVDRFHLVRNGGDIVACGALWDQRGFRQTVVRGYSAPWRALRPLLNGVAAWLGTPRLPAVGTVLDQAFLSPLAVEEESWLPDFVEGFFPKAAALGLEYLTLGLPVDAPALPVLRRRFATRRYASRLYGVTWTGRSFEKFAPGAGGYFPEIGLL